MNHQNAGNEGSDAQNFPGGETVDFIYTKTSICRNLNMKTVQMNEFHLM